MNQKKGFSIAKFAQLSRTKRETLIFYDRIGLLFPDSRGENRYRVYSSDQLAIANLIHTFRELGVSLEEIGDIIKCRTPDIVDDLLERQIVQIDETLEKWKNARKLLSVLRSTIRSVRNVDTRVITIEPLPAEAIIYGELIDYTQGKNDYDALLDFYISFNKEHPNMDLNYPVWGIFSEDRIRRGEMNWPDRYYFHNPDGFERRPAALYAIGYDYCGYGEVGSLIKRMLQHIDANSHDLCGLTYVEYPLNEICVSNPSDYLVRVLMTVKKRT